MHGVARQINQLVGLVPGVENIVPLQVIGRVLSAMVAMVITLLILLRGSDSVLSGRFFTELGAMPVLILFHISVGFSEVVIPHGVGDSALTPGDQLHPGQRRNTNLFPIFHINIHTCMHTYIHRQVKSSKIIISCKAYE